MFGSIGMPELIIIFVIALIIFGPRKLPELGRSLGKSLSEFKRASNELQSTLEEEIRIEEQRESRRVKAQPASRPRPTVARGTTEPTKTTSPWSPEPTRRPEALRQPWPSCPSPAPSRGRSSVPPEDPIDDDDLPAGRCRFWSISTSSGSASSTPASPSPSASSSSFFFIQRIFDFLTRADAARRCPPGSKLIYTQPGEAFSLYITDLADRGRRPRRAVHHVSGLAVHRAGPVLERKEVRDPVRAVLDARASSAARRSITTSRSRS